MSFANNVQKIEKQKRHVLKISGDTFDTLKSMLMENRAELLGNSAQQLLPSLRKAEI